MTDWLLNIFDPAVSIINGRLVTKVPLWKRIFLGVGRGD